MSADGELLEMAAKAAGMGDEPFSPKNGYSWNPLADDGDALRLELALVESGLTVIVHAGREGVTVEIFRGAVRLTKAHECGADAHRRARVRAAAKVPA